MYRRFKELEVLTIRAVKGSTGTILPKSTNFCRRITPSFFDEKTVPGWNVQYSLIKMLLLRTGVANLARI